jgi:hypothetical protein
VLAPSEGVPLPGVGDSDGGISMLPDYAVAWSRLLSMIHKELHFPTRGTLAT